MTTVTVDLGGHGKCEGEGAGGGLRERGRRVEGPEEGGRGAGHACLSGVGQRAGPLCLRRGRCTTTACGQAGRLGAQGGARRKMGSGRRHSGRNKMRGIPNAGGGGGSDSRTDGRTDGRTVGRSDGRTSTRHGRRCKFHSRNTKPPKITSPSFQTKIECLNVGLTIWGGDP